MLMVINKHTQFAGPGRTNSNVVGYPMMPVYMSKMGGFLFITFGVIVLIASLFTINPIWNYGPYDPSPVSAGTQPDWYIGFADGALRLVPPGWEFVFLDRTWSFNILVPLVGLGLFIVVVADLPLHRGVDHRRQARAPHRPASAQRGDAHGDRRRRASRSTRSCGRRRPPTSSRRTSTLTMEGVIHTLQALLVIGPIIAYFVTKRICIALQKKDREIALHGYESGRIVRLPGGEYIEVHQPVDEYERWKLVDNDNYEPLIVRPNAKGRIPWHENIRAVALALALRGPPRPAHAVRARRRGRAPAPRAGAHRDRGGRRAPGRARARRCAGCPARPDRRRSQLRDGRSPVERDRRRRRHEEAAQPREGTRPVALDAIGCPGTTPSVVIVPGHPASHGTSAGIRRRLTAQRTGAASVTA